MFFQVREDAYYCVPIHKKQSDCVTVAQQTLTLFVLVRIQVGLHYYQGDDFQVNHLLFYFLKPFPEAGFGRIRHLLYWLELCWFPYHTIFLPGRQGIEVFAFHQNPLKATFCLYFER